MAASAEAAAGVELTRRVTADGRRFLFAINHGREDAEVKADGEELLGGGRFGGIVAGGAVAVIAED